MAHLYKSRLQNYAQKRNIAFPIYGCEMQGPPHCRLFKANVTIDGNTYVGPEFCSTLKDAEHAAAKVAFLSLSPDGSQEDDCLYKSLLQELAQKRGLPLPLYTTNRSGQPHVPSFGSTVQIAGECYVGEEARTKKQAEMNAAKVAYTALIEGGPRANNSATSSNMHMVGTSSLQTVPIHKNGPTLVSTTGASTASNSATSSNIQMGASISGSHSLQTVTTHKNGPTLVSTTGAPRASNSATFSSMHMVGTSSVGSHSSQMVMTQENEATSKMETTNSINEARLKIAQDAVKGEGYLDLKNLQDVIEKHAMTRPQVVTHQSQPKPTPNAANYSTGQENLVSQAGEGSSPNGRKLHVSFNDTASKMGPGGARPQATKIVIRPHVAGMVYAGPIKVSDDEWVAMQVNIDEET